MPDTFFYGPEAVAHLKSRDAALGAAIDQIGPIERAVNPDLFAKYRRRHTPHNPVASLYLWAIASGQYPGWSDPAAKPPRR